MPVGSILDSRSFSALDATGQKAVRQLFDKIYQADEQLMLADLQLYKHRTSLAVPLDFYTRRLDKTNLASFKFLNRVQRAALHQDLLFTFYLVSAQYQLDATEGLRQSLRQLALQIKYCACLIKELRKAGQRTTPATILASAVDDDSEKYLKYFGLFIASRLVNGALAVGAERTKVIKEDVAYVNGIRGQWSRAGGLVSRVIDQLPDYVINKHQALERQNILAPITGYMSWILYYTHFGIDLVMLLKHTFRGPWMSQAEKNLTISTGERFQTQWDQHKFSLLSDFNWGTAYMVCFFWLTGSGIPGYLGKVLTVGFLLIDVQLTLWRFSEEKTRHNVEMERYAHDRKSLCDKIIVAEQTENKEQKEILQLQLETLIQAETQCKFEWKYKKYKLNNDLAYAASLILAFSLIYCFLFPPAIMLPATAMMIGIIGSSLYFICNLAYTAVSYDLDVVKSQETCHLIKIECEKRLQKFSALTFDKAIDPNGFVKKQLYLEMKQLWADIDYQKRLAHFQTIKLIRSVLINTLVPSLMFVLFLFMPLGICLAVLAVEFTLATVSRMVINEPTRGKIPVLNEMEYAKFESLPAPMLDDLSNNSKTKTLAKCRFFSAYETKFQPQLGVDGPIL